VERVSPAEVRRAAKATLLGLLLGMVLVVLAWRSGGNEP
jgi:hypothetical protein